ncbi:hypothetical protein EW146_g4890 [Bondarzewia mesenterica]|uniref:Zn(2)-C6 fungal-type domain-containing protein n=1 Tax=Bondarzewia mesenterica TaxID=1095465 RepID=A0A4S4LTP4_9AGAM|nr:hypothetical protein EW146_g4890 [Bondarzewia mesenterica]
MSSSSKRPEPPTSAPEPVKKRRRGATRLSCAECRRLKLRCDRNIPCSSCVKRGCGAICPDGSLTTGQGNRFVLASTQELHEKITELCTRVRELEDALRVSHKQTSSETHPLLSDDLLRVKAPLQRDVSLRSHAVNNQPEDDDTNPDDVDSFGTLSISDSGQTKYYGQPANSWYFLQNEDMQEECPDDRSADLQGILPPEILEISSSFRLAPMNKQTSEAISERLRSLYWYLPPADKAAELRDIYFSHAAWMYNPIPVADFNETVYSAIYKSQMSTTPDEPLIVRSQRLALMFMVLAIGSLMDDRLPSYSIEAEKYHQLARATLFQNSVFSEPTLGAVQALFLMTFYLFFADRHGGNAGPRWAIMGLAVKLAQSIGLHRDTGRLGVEPIETRRRREVFWELFVYDSWQCLTFGRPPAFVMAQIDCKLPHPNIPGTEEAFHAWKHRFSSVGMSVVHDQAFGAKTPTYATILQLDRKLRACPVPPILQIAGFGNSTESQLNLIPEPVSMILQRHLVLAVREMNLLYMHRSFFARALSDHPKDPLGSPYGTSVIAAYRSAGSLVALIRNLHSQAKEPTERLWFLWTHMFSCAIVLGAIVTRCPSMSLSPSALVQLDSACELFSRTAQGFRARKVLTFRDGKAQPATRYKARAPSTSSMDEDEDEDELLMLGGKMRLVSKNQTSTTASSPVVIERSPTSMNPVVPLPLNQATEGPMDPNVVDYLRTFVLTPNPLPTTGAQTATTAINRAPISLPPSISSLAVGSGALVGLPTQPQPQTVTANPAPAMQYQQTGPSLFDFTGVPAFSSPVPFPSSQAQQPSHSMHPQAGLDLNFPQYFPVFDYSASGMNGLEGFYTMDMGGMLPEEPRGPNTTTPEATMQGTWQDFVAQLGMT